MNNENEYIIIMFLLGVANGIGILLIIDKEFIEQVLGFCLFGVSLGSLFLIGIEKLIIELKPKQQNRHGVEQ